MKIFWLNNLIYRRVVLLEMLKMVNGVIYEDMRKRISTHSHPRSQTRDTGRTDNYCLS